MSSNEFMGVDLDTIPYQVDERVGHLQVWYSGLILARFPWHSHAQVDDKGALHIMDLSTQRWVKHYSPGSWTRVDYAP